MTMTHLPSLDAPSPWHARTAAEVSDYWQVGNEGLHDTEADRRLRHYGPNTIPATRKISWFVLFVRQFRSLLILILFVAAAIAWSAGKMVDVYVILAVVLINAFIGFFQELRAENAVEALRRMMVLKARVRRNGEVREVAAADLVPGDVILIGEGDSVPADARILTAKNLRMVEASLTGESVPVAKYEAALDSATPLAERRNMLWKGTHCVGGQATAVVCATGTRTEFGRIARTLESIPDQRSNFQKKSDHLARQMALLSIASAVALFVTGYFFRGMEINEIMLASIAALVSVIPEGLPAVLSIVLAIGSHHMARRNAIIREFTSVETLGSVTTIITDKTGTLTQNMLTVKKVALPDGREWEVSGEGWSPVGSFFRGGEVVEPGDDPALVRLLQVAGNSNDASIRHDLDTGTYTLVGDPTEGALLVLARKGGLPVARQMEGHRLDDLPFSSHAKFRASLFQTPSGEKEILVSGAPEKILALSGRMDADGGRDDLSSEDRKRMESLINEWSGRAMRVIGLAWKRVAADHEEIEESDVRHLVFAGIIGMIDPPRPEVREAVMKCRDAGIRVIMATGDHLQTAMAIARETGIVGEVSPDVAPALTEAQLGVLDEREFGEAVRSTHVFARLTPAMKLRICETLQDQGELVAMTGDGVNDAPALKKADVGVAMGVMGTDVAREASRVVLADDNFSTIVNAVEEGRIVFANARQTSYFLLSTNFSEITILISLVAMGYPIALTATQILWLNLVTDGLGDKALAAERGHGRVLLEKPLTKKDQILNKEVMPFLLGLTILMTGLALGVYFHFLPAGIDKARTAVFSTMAFSQLWNLLNMRSMKQSVFAIGIFSNPWVVMAFVISAVVQVLIIEVPLFVSLFGFFPLSGPEFLAMFALSSTVLWAGEAWKLFGRWVRREARS